MIYGLTLLDKILFRFPGLKVWWTERKLHLGLKLYAGTQKDLNAIARRHDGRLPEELHHYVKDQLNQRQEWLSQIDKLKAAGILSEKKAMKLRALLD